MATYPNPLNTMFLDKAIQKLPDDFFTRQGYMARRFFPERVLPEDKIMWEETVFENAMAGIYGRGSRPVSSSGELPFTAKWAAMVHLMASENIDPNSVKDYRQAGEIGIYNNSALGISAYNRLLKKVSTAQRLVDNRIETLIEYLGMNALQGEIMWPPQDVLPENWQPDWGNHRIDQEILGFESNFSQKATTLTGVTRNGVARPGGGKKWTATNADPILDLEVIADLMNAETGVSARGSMIICSSSVVSFLVRNTNFTSLLGVGKQIAPKIVSWQAIEDWIQTQFGYNFLLYDAQYTYRVMGNLGTANFRNVQKHRFLKEGRLIILPPQAQTPGELGYLGTTEVKTSSGYKAGKYTYLVEDKEPPFEIRLGEGGVFWPVIHRPWEIFIFDAWE